MGTDKTGGEEKAFSIISFAKKGPQYHILPITFLLFAGVCLLERLS